MTAVNSVDILLIYNISLKIIYFFFYLAFAFTLVKGDNETGEKCLTDSTPKRVKSFVMHVRILQQLSTS